ncbi:ATP-binding protein [Nocardioides stalactiti]|uniref:ATP-binding protein n=1 Tax=Nocardioides stalactiti TaxID=2755356 RepID=UPI0015FF8F7E|nr:ATP-binding protein [Nocardioides stalactiti]
MRARVGGAVGWRAGFFAAYLLAGVIGRASVVDSDRLALVWPAAGLAVVWLVTRPTRKEWWYDVPLLAILGAAVIAIVGLSPMEVAILGGANLVAVLATVAALHEWCPGTGRTGRPPTCSPAAMFGFLLAALAGATAGVGAGAIGLWAAGRDVPLDGLAVWWGRDVCGMLAVGSTALLIVDRIRRGRAPETATGGRIELALLFTATALLVLCDYLTLLPVTFLMPAVAVWAGSRFTPLAVAAHALAGGMGVLWLTSQQHGPFSDIGGTRTGILLAQLFIAMTLVIGLFLAAAKEARTELQAHLLAQEREQSQELLTFARRAAHDLRNPLSVVESWTTELSETLAAGPIPAPTGASTMLAGIERATARMRALVDDLLADAAARDRAPTHAVVDLPALVADVAMEYDAVGLIRTFGVRSVTGDPVLLRQLFDNLVANALKYIRPGQLPEITVSSHHDGDRVVIRVTDNGIGIPDGAHEWIFEPFRRAHDEGYPGTGLGLSTCRRIVERHGGSMRALTRSDGPGSVFELDLPPARAPLPAAAVPLAAADPADPPAADRLTTA